LALYLVGILCFYLDLRASRLENIFADFSICISFPIFFLILHLIPSAPSSAGVLHFGIFKALVIIAKSKGIIITAALENQILFSAAVFHFSLFFPETAVGLYYMLRERTILFDLRKSGLLKKS
jgi:hypothetical protein